MSFQAFEILTLSLSPMTYIGPYNAIQSLSHVFNYSWLANYKMWWIPCGSTNLQPTITIPFPKLNCSSSNIIMSVLYTQEATSYSKVIQEKIDKARIEAKYLFTEVENAKRQIKDKRLLEQSSIVARIPNHSVNPRLYSSLEGHQEIVTQIQWNGQSSLILSASQDGYMIIWDTVTGLKKSAIPLENQWVLSCALSPDELLAVSGGLDNKLTIYNVNGSSNRLAYFNSNVNHVFKGHSAYISDCQFLNNQQILSSSGDMKCLLWDLHKEGKVRDFVEHLGDVLCMDLFNSNVKGTQFSDNLFISGGSDSYCKIWDMRCKTSVQSLFVSNYDINTVKIFPQALSFITGLDDGILRLYDLRSDCELSSYSVLEKLQEYKRSSIQSDAMNILSVDFSKSGRLIYSCYSDFGCIIWDTLKQEIVGAIDGQLNKITQVRVSPDGVGICTTGRDSTIKIWAQ